MKRVFMTAMSAIAVLLLLFGCGEQTEQEVWFDTYRDIPGITDGQIREIGRLRDRYDYFVYGMLLNDETFYTTGGEIVGFSAEMCRWLTDLFGIEFVPVIFNNLPELMDGLEDGTIHFTGQFPRMPFLQERFYMTTPISTRSVAVVRPHYSRAFSEIRLERELRFAFETGSALPAVFARQGRYGNFEYVSVSVGEAAELLRNGEADAFFGDGVLMADINFPGFCVRPIYPFMFGASAFSARRDTGFEPIIDAVQLILDNNGMSILARHYTEGKNAAARHRIDLLLTDEEREFIAQNPVIPIAVHGFSYPISFFNDWDGEYQGIALDILREVEIISGLRFEMLEGNQPYLREVLRSLGAGEAYLATTAFRTADDSPFLLTTGFFSDSYTLLSRTDTPIISVSEVVYKRVGYIDSGHHTELFHSMFPDHLNTFTFPHQDYLLAALESGEVDLIFTSLRGLHRATNLLERTDFRANIIFEETYTVSFAVNENMPLLASVLDHAIMIVDTQAISDDWMGRTFDFNERMLRRQIPWLVGTVLLLFTVLVLSTVLFQVQRRKAAMEHAEESNRAKTRFLARMSHEIRTPITSVLGISEIQLRSPTIPPKTEEAFVKIHDAANMLLNIVNDILDFSKIESGKLSVVDRKYEVASLVSDAAHLHMVYLDHKNFIFKMNVDENLPAKLIGDELRIRQIMNNLLSNAFKYTESGVVALEVGFEEKSGEEITLLITVRDTGLGLTEAQLEEIRASEYTRFHEQGERSGTGLGIHIVYSLAQLMDAQVEFSSKVNSGTNVTVRIPQKAVGTEILGNETATSLQHFEFGTWHKQFKFMPEPMPYGKVLVVDDVDSNLFVAKGLLEFYRLEVETCIGGSEAIEKINRGGIYDVIFMDSMMPGLNGTETMQIIKNTGYNEPIIALTANAIVGQAEEFKKSGFDDFISKPIQTAQLNSVLTKYVRDKQPPEVIAKAKAEAVPVGDIESYNSEVAEKLRVDFAKNKKYMARDIINAVISDDTGTAKLLAHTLKGLAALINENALHLAAKNVDIALSQNNTPDTALLNALNAEMTRTLAGIKIPDDAPASKVLEKAAVLALFDKLEPLLKSRDTACIVLLDELRAFTETAIIAHQIEEFEFDDALKNLDTLRRILND